MFSSLFVIFVTFLSSVPSHADFTVTEDQCSPVDLAARFPEPKNQGGSGVCYGFAASDLLADALHLPPPTTVSAMQEVADQITLSRPEAEAAIELAFNQDDWNLDNVLKTEEPMNQRDAGWPGITLARTLIRGTYCLESDLPSQSMWKNDRDFFVKELMELSGADTLVTLAKGLPSYESYIPQLNDFAAAKLKSVINDRCQNPLPPNLTVKSYFTSEVNQSWPDFINQELDAGKTMVLGFENCRLFTWCRISGKLNHANVIVGRQWNQETRSCELKLRGTYGSTCDNRLRPGTRCDGGYYWIKMDEVLKGSLELTYMPTVQ